MTFAVIFSRRAAWCGLVCAVLAFFAAGCGGSGTRAVILPAPSPSAAPTPAPTPSPSPGTTLISHRVTAVYTAAQIDAAVRQTGILGVAPAQNAVQLLYVTYSTTTPNGQKTVASGLVALPAAAPVSPAPLVVYHHGAVFGRTEVPSQPTNTEGLAVSALFAAQGYAVAAPDYVGLGVSTEPQTFGRAAALVPPSLDLVRAARSVAALQQIPLSAQLFLTGYSEGGYATLAVQKAMQDANSAEFSVTASAPLAGFYDLSGTTLRGFLDAPTPLTTAVVAEILIQNNAVGDFYASENEVFAPPYNDGRLSALFDGTHASNQVLAVFSPNSAAVFAPAYLSEIAQNPNHPVNVFLRANDVYDFTPVAPTRFFHGGADPIIPFANAVVAVSRMQARGAANVSLVNVGDTLNHDTAVVPSFLGAKAFFDGFR